MSHHKKTKRLIYSYTVRVDYLERYKNELMKYDNFSVSEVIKTEDTIKTYLEFIKDLSTL